MPSRLTQATNSTVDAIDRKPKRTNSWETRNAIVYDVSSQTLSKIERKAIEAGDTRIKIPKRPLIPLKKDNVRIFIPSNSTAELDTESDVLAEVKLSSLGLKVALERYRGNIHEIWVKGTSQCMLRGS